MENSMSRILLLGLDPETVDYSDPALPPGMTAEKVHAGIAVALKQFTDRGWESDVGYINAIRHVAPGAAIALNTRPDDSADAAARGLALGSRVV
jgi:hypothetical protein